MRRHAATVRTQYWALSQSGKRLHDLLCLRLSICPTGLAYPIELDNINPSLAQLALGYKGVFSVEFTAKLPLCKAGTFADFSDGLSNDLALFAIDSLAHVPILGTRATCPQNRDNLEYHHEHKK